MITAITHTWAFFIIIIFLGFNLSLLQCNTQAQKKHVKINSVETIVKKAVLGTMQHYEIPGIAVALYAHGEPYVFHFGYADKKTKAPVTDATLFEVGSITKIFTCLLIAQEVHEGRMRLTDSIDMHIPQLVCNKRLKTTTLEKLATHTATLSFNAPDTVKSYTDLLNYLSTWKPCIDTTQWWQYSNHGIELLRIALELSASESYNQLLVNRILKPLHMSPIGIKVPENYQRYCAIGYGKNGNQITHWKHPFLWGSGALRASSKDMLQFLKAALDLPGTPGSIRKAMQLTQTPHVSLKHGFKHGLGWQISDAHKFYLPGFNLFNKYEAQEISKKNKVYSNAMVFDKGGTTHGFHAYIAVMPDRKTGIVIMMNRVLPQGRNIIKKLGKEILRNVASVAQNSHDVVEKKVCT